MIQTKWFLCAFALLTIAQLSANDKPPALPQGETFHWGKEPIVETSSTRGEICLNGNWYFQPLIGETKRPDGDWAAIRVPGSWDSQGTWGNAQLPGLVGRPPLWSGIKYRSDNAPTRTYIENLTRGWYERELEIPKEWAGRKICLDFQRISTDAEILINTQKVGTTTWPSGTVDITSFVKPGTKATLAVAVTAIGSEKELLVAMREDYADKGDNALRQRGIIGNVWLRSEPLKTALRGIAIQPSVQKKEIAVVADLQGLEKPLKAKITTTVREWPGNTEAKVFTSEVSLNPNGPNRVSWPWDNAKLWEIGQPNLYTLSFKIEAEGLSDEITERFGFREFRIEGRNFLLNEKVFHGRTAHASADNNGGMREAAQAGITRALNNGYNLLEIWPNDSYRRGFSDFRADYAQFADEKGILILMPAVRPDDIFQWNKEIQPDPYAKWMNANRQHINQVRNSPSVAGYIFFGNEFMTSDDQNPHRLGNRAALAQSQQKDVAPALKMLEDLRHLDPSRFFASHSGGQVGDIQTINHYLGLTPMQEGEETPAIWSKTGDMPFASVEFCTPFSADMHRARQSWNTESEPLFTEFMAAQLGQKAYELEKPEYRTMLLQSFDKTKKAFSKSPGGIGNQTGYEGYSSYAFLQEPAFRRIWRSWRTWGVSGGMIQWEKVLEPEIKGEVAVEPFQPGRRGFYFPKVPANWVYDKPLDVASLAPHQRAYYDGIQPLMAYLGGGAKEDGWVGKEHHFTSGAQVEQSAVLVNDSRTDQPYVVSWSAEIAGQPVSLKGEETGTILVGEPKILPISFTSPVVTEKTIVNLTLQAVMGSGEQAKTLTDKKALTLYPATPAKKSITLSLFDPEGATSRELASLGYTITPWLRGAPAAGSIAVIGRKGMSDAKFPASELRDFIKAGGRAVIFSQDPDFLRSHAGVRVHRWAGRQFWPVATQKTHPILAGFTGEDLRDWTGAGTLLAPYNQDDLTVSAQRKGYPMYGYRVGTRGSVGSSAWEKPHRSGWTPLIEGEFDLTYSPLMELNLEKGLVLFCSLDIEDRNDPAAKLLTQRVLDYTAEAKIQPRRKVFYMGNAEGENFLKSLSVPYIRVAGQIPAGSILVIGPGETVGSPWVRSVLASGGRVLAFGQETIPSGPPVKPTPFVTVLDPLPAWPELRGITPSDLRLRTEKTLPLLSGAANGWELAAGGLLGRKVEGPGVLIVFQGNPSTLDVANEPYYRFSQWRWTRTVSQLLANLGAGFTNDLAFFNLKPNPYGALELSGNWRTKLELSLPASASPDSPSVDPGMKDIALSKPEFNDTSWEQVKLPTMNSIGTIDLEKIDGIVWARKKITVPAEWKNQGDLNLTLGNMDDHDITYFNGNKVGGIGKEDAKSWSKPRTYRIAAWMVKPGEENTIAIRLFDQFGGGGFGAGGTPLSMNLELRKTVEQAGYYLPGFRVDKEMGDDPARYTRW